MLLIGDIYFEWDADKEVDNISKHGLSFYEAVTVFDDDNALYFYDDAHSDMEDRFIILGLSDKANLILVCHCYREEDSMIRIISAREATTTEYKLYGGA